MMMKIISKSSREVLKRVLLALDLAQNVDVEAALFSSSKSARSAEKKGCWLRPNPKTPGAWDFPPHQNWWKLVGRRSRSWTFSGSFWSCFLSLRRFFAVSLAAHIFDRCRDFVVSKQCDTLISSGFSVTHHELNRWIGTLKKPVSWWWVI